jgi:hypothetical protein
MIVEFSRDGMWTSPVEGRDGERETANGHAPDLLGDKKTDSPCW